MDGRSKFAIVVCGMSLLAGCMSMDEMLASDDPFWRDMGESQAMRLAIDQYGTADLQAKLDAVGKMRDQTKLAKIYAAKSTVPEVKKAARAKITEDTAFAAMLVGCKDPAIWKEALANIKSDEALVAAAAGLLEEGPVGENVAGSKRPLAEQLLCRVKSGEAVGEYLARIVSRGELRQTSNLYSEQMRFSDRYEIYKIFARHARPCPAIDALKRNERVLATKGADIYDFYTPLEVADILGWSDAWKVKILKERRGRSYYLSNGNSSWNFEITPEAILSSMKDASCIADYIASCEYENDIAVAMRYVKDPKARGAIAVARLERFAKEGILGHTQEGDGMPSEASRLSSLVSEASVENLKRVAPSVSAKVLSPVSLAAAWNHDKINFSIVREMAERCKDKALTAELYAHVADCIGRVHAESTDGFKNAVKGISGGATYSWAATDQAKAVGIMKSWAALADMEVVKEAVAITAKNVLCGVDYLAAGRTESEQTTVRQWMVAAWLKELSVIEDKDEATLAMLDAVGRGQYLENWTDGKTDITTDLQRDQAFDGYPICIGARVETVRKSGSQVVADIGMISVMPNFGEAAISIDELLFKVVATDEKNKQIAAQWNTLDKVYVHGVFKFLDSKKYLGEIAMTGVLDAQTVTTLSADAAKARSIRAALKEIGASVPEPRFLPKKNPSKE